MFQDRESSNYSVSKLDTAIPQLSRCVEDILGQFGVPVVYSGIKDSADPRIIAAFSRMPKLKEYARVLNGIREAFPGRIFMLPLSSHPLQTQVNEIQAEKIVIFAGLQPEKDSLASALRLPALPSPAYPPTTDPSGLLLELYPTPYSAEAARELLLNPHLASMKIAPGATLRRQTLGITV